VTGLPCTGKTTVARQLAAALGLPLVTKDDIKERLFDTLGWSDRTWSRKLGGATYEVLYYVIEAILAGDASLIAESNFPPDLAGLRLAEIAARRPFRTGMVECIARAETLRRRWRERAEAAIRHPGHNDAAALEEFLQLVDAHTSADGYARLGAPIPAAWEPDPPVWVVDTSHPPALDDLVAQIRQHFKV
jgi:predicted kinase